MLHISDQLRFFLWVLIGISGFVTSGLLILLGGNIAFHLRRLIPGEKQEGEPPKPRPLATWIIFGVASVFTILGTAIVSTADSNTPVETMNGDYRVVVSHFVLQENTARATIEKDLALSSFERIQKSLLETQSDLFIKVWGPDDLETRKIEPVTGRSVEERAASAQALANLIDADLVVYGFIQSNGTTLTVTPEFYIRIRNSYEAQELIGPYMMGDPIAMRDYEDLASRLEISSELSDRVLALSQMIKGLAFYAIRQYPQAQEQFSQAEAIESWEPSEGKEILYLFLGNSVIREEEADLDTAQSYFQKALEIRPDYSRAMIGLANVKYRKALAPVTKSNDPADADEELLQEAVDLLTAAAQSSNQPPLADVPTKTHFELGQCYFMLTYSGHLDTYALATSEFKQVIADYGDGANPRVKERAAEAYARMGLILALSGDTDEAIQNYQTAAEMTDDNPERQAIFLERIQKLQNNQSMDGGN